MSVNWRKLECWWCLGQGLTETRSGGSIKCSNCGGDGFFWVSPQSRVADFPGGHFRGTFPGAYEEAVGARRVI